MYVNLKTIFTADFLMNILNFTRRNIVNFRFYYEFPILIIYKKVYLWSIHVFRYILTILFNRCLKVFFLSNVLTK